MKLSDHLRQLKKIAPGEEYSRRSRLMIVGMPEIQSAPFTLKRFFFHNLELASAIALTGVLLLLGFGGLSAWRFLSPFRLSSLDPAGLEAEAEAVRDIQVALQGIQYVPETTSTAPVLQPLIRRSSPKPGTPPTATSSEDEVPSLAVDGATTTVDEALDLLLE